MAVAPRGKVLLRGREPAAAAPAATGLAGCSFTACPKVCFVMTTILFLFPTWALLRVVRRRGFLRSAVQGELLVGVAMIAGQLAAEPLGRLEAVALLLRGELDLGDDQPLEITVVDVDVGAMSVLQWHEEAALRDASRLGQLPELIEAVRVERDFDLLPSLAGPLLGGEQLLVVEAAQANLDALVDRQVALDDAGRLMLVEARGLRSMRNFRSVSCIPSGLRAGRESAR